MYVTEFSNSINSLKSAFRFMLAQLQKNVQTLLWGKLLVKIAVRFFRSVKVREFLNRFFHEQVYHGKRKLKC